MGLTMERSLQGLPPISKSNGPHCSIWMVKEEQGAGSIQCGAKASSNDSKHQKNKKKRAQMKSLSAKSTQRNVVRTLSTVCEHTCSWVMNRTSPTWTIFPSWLTVDTAIESSQTSEATYFSTLKPRSFSTR